MQLHWVKNTKQDWIDLARVDLSSVKTTGVYVIWQGFRGGKVVRIGQGDIKARLTEHRQNYQIMRHAGSNGLLVTWASVNSLALDGVESYLAQQYSPIEGERFPDVVPIQVNLLA